MMATVMCLAFVTTLLSSAFVSSTPLTFSSNSNGTISVNANVLLTGQKRPSTMEILFALDSPVPLSLVYCDTDDYATGMPGDQVSDADKTKLATTATPYNVTVTLKATAMVLRHYFRTCLWCMIVRDDGKWTDFCVDSSDDVIPLQSTNILKDTTKLRDILFNIHETSPHVLWIGGVTVGLVLLVLVLVPVTAWAAWKRH